MVYATACVYRELYGKTTDREKNCVNTKQLLDEVEHDIMNYQNRGLCYLPQSSASADNTDTRFIIHFSHNSSSETGARRSAILFLRRIQ